MKTSPNMKQLLKTASIGIIGTLLLLGLLTPVLGNAWGMLIERGYHIPDESSIFKFETTKMNEGSGDYWLYGEYDAYYYSIVRSDSDQPYIKIKKTKAKQIPDFNKTNIKTWR